MASTSFATLPQVPAKHEDFIDHLDAHPNSAITELLGPYKQYDAKLREIFAQTPDHPSLSNNLLNLTPLYNGQESKVTVRARDLTTESEEEKGHYIMPLPDEARKQTGTLAIVPSLKEFQTNFNLFSEQSLVDMDWSNVIVAGSAVVTALLPVPEEHKVSKKLLREYYHEIVAPASDVDLFLYGLDEQGAIEKIKRIEQSIRDAILTETTTIRTKNTITIASQYPTRHVQIVLRTYKSIAEILTGFDVDCACVAYTGTQVICAPRALAAYMTQINTVDLTRRSPSYENRLSKYSHRGFEIYWPNLDRSKIDPTIFERSFSRTVGLARLLILEKLPNQSDREAYQDQRRQERGRPALNRYYINRNRTLPGNIKESHEDEVAEWVEQDEISNYHTLTIPYGPKYTAKKIEKLLYAKDLLLNAEWNNEDRLEEVNLHRHPAFFGTVSDVIKDCCGFCPKPALPEEEKVAEEESKHYVSGCVSFIKDDPGRQAIGSFNPITDADWTGRTPLQLAVQSSTPAIVKCLVDHDARMIARQADGRTALHLACARGNLEMIKILLERSEANEEAELEREEAMEAQSLSSSSDSSKDTDMIDAERAGTSDEDVDMKSATSASFVKIEHEREQPDNDNLPTDDNTEDPDIYDIDVLAWDVASSPLHMAISRGHTAVVRELVQTYGADVLLPVKLFNEYDKSPRAAILTLVLALSLPYEKAKDMALTLLELGASSAQADMKQVTAFHYYVAKQSEATQILFERDMPAVRRAINHLAVGGSSWSAQIASPLMTAIVQRDTISIIKLLEAGATAKIEFATFMKAVQTQYEDYGKNRTSEQNHDNFKTSVEQPIVLAAQSEQPAVVLELLHRGSDPNTLTCTGHHFIQNQWCRPYTNGESLMDLVDRKLDGLRKYKGEELPAPPRKTFDDDEALYFHGIEPGSYKQWAIQNRLGGAKHGYEEQLKSYGKQLEQAKTRKGLDEKKEAIRALLAGFEEVKAELEQGGAKGFKQLYPDITASMGEHDNRQPMTPEHHTFQVKFDFSLPDLTEEKREAYLRIFQAAWTGDLSTIKSFTLGLWSCGHAKHQTPLPIAVQDSHEGFTAFHLALLRGHLDTAKGILEIAQLQYQSPAMSKRKYRLSQTREFGGETNESDEDSSPNIQSEPLDDVFTIDNVGEIPAVAKSNISPVALMTWSCQVSKLFGETNCVTSDLFQHAIEQNDSGLMRLLLEWVDHYYAACNTSENSPGCFRAPRKYLDQCIRLGRTQLLSELIRGTGCGVSLKHLVQISGVEVREKPTYYQGLSVYGKKRKDWAKAGRGNQQSAGPITQHPPALQAAFDGNIDSLEWFLSDAALRCYSEFASKHGSGRRLRALAQAPGGFEKVMSTFLKTRFSLILHCAVMAKPGPKTVKLLPYPLKAFPQLLEARCASAHTPLHLAFSLKRRAFAKILIDAGADQTTRDDRGKNLVHTLLNPIDGGEVPDAKMVKEMLALIDPRLRTSLVVERCSDGPGSATPLARWLHRVPSRSDRDVKSANEVAILRVVLDFAGDDSHLAQFDGAGDTPMHVLVKNERVDLIAVILERDPLLVYRENATGRTPAEMAEDICTARDFSGNPHIHMGSPHTVSTVEKAPEFFVHGAGRENSKGTQANPSLKVLQLCQEVMARHPSRRKLVTLQEANEVARRLAAQQAKSRKGRHGQSSGAARSDLDEVAKWYSTAAQWTDKVLEEVTSDV
ncbi:MAG: hypothetical protein M1821_006252 [Bathelium mastoideum]|nr:MAG: hypothetical protein M1821_006252 [Bathelium mastoideum]